MACYLLYRPVCLIVFMLGNDRDGKIGTLSTFQASMRALGTFVPVKAYEFIVQKLRSVDTGQIVRDVRTKKSL